MNKKIFSILLATVGLMPLQSFGVAENRALHLESSASVRCGVMPRLNGAESYTIQFWINPEKWSTGATLFTVGNAGKISLGDANSLVFDLGGSRATLTNSEIAVGQWTQITLIRDGATTKTFVNGTRRACTGTLGAMPEMKEEFVMGGDSYVGRIDEVRLWNAALSSDFNYFIGNTINRWTPQRANLVAYYKFDQRNCPDAAVEYSILWPGADTSYDNHGRFSGNVTKVSAKDNTRMPYLVNGAYTANERFFDRVVRQDQYLMSNDLIILGIESMPDGHLRNVNPDNHAKFAGGYKILPEFEGRTGVLSLDGTGTMTAPCETLMPTISASGETLTGYTIEGWVYIDEWVEGAYIFCKETPDHKQGVSLRLGAESNHQLIARCNGNDYVQYKRGANDPELVVGKWCHVALTPGLASAPRNAFAFVVDGKTGSAVATLSSAEVVYTPKGVDAVEAVIGQGFKGKIDELAVWDRTLGLSDIVQHSQKMLLPEIGQSKSAEMLMDGNAFWNFDDASNPGFSYLSQEGWKRIMESCYAGHDGYEIRISVKSHNGWESTIANAAKRKIFAADLARLSAPYDGVELDLEWLYGTQTTLGLLAQDIREVLPAGKTLMISCHNVAYGFPLDKMKYVDGFTMQQYGPQKDHSYFSHFKNMCTNFVNYGFEKHKILGSYATTTSMGYLNGERKVEIIGVKDGLMEGDYVPQEEVDFGVHNGYTFYFDGPLQTYNRAKYIMDNNLGGIFYWDMGNDTQPEHPHNLARHCSYGLNSNVEPVVTKVDFNHIAGVEEVLGDVVGKDLKLELTPGGVLIATVGNAQVRNLEMVNMSGMRVANADAAQINVNGIPTGVYVVTATTTDGRRFSGKFIRK